MAPSARPADNQLTRAQPERGGDPEDEPKMVAAQRADGVPGQRTTTGTTHPLVDVAVEHTVEGVGAGRGEAAADHREQHQESGGTPPAARNIAGTVVTSRSSMMRGLVSPK